MIENASQLPRIFYCRHMQPGIARYENETILVDSDGMKNLVASAGKRSIPVYINHQDVDLKNIKEQASGYVSDSFYNEMDGWAWFKFIAIDDKAHDAIKKGWAVSNAYMPSEWGPAGTKNNCPYNREVRNGEFTHLAIVPDPRYEGACIMTPEEFKNYQDTQRKKLSELQNSKPKGKHMFKLFKNTKEEVTGSTVDLDTCIELGNGKSLSIKEMIEAVVENSKTKETQTVEVNGKKMSVEELVNAYTKINGKKKTKKNSEEPLDMDEEDVEGDQEEEGDDEIGTDKKNKKMKKNKKEKKNADDEEDDFKENDMEGDEEDEAEGVEAKNKKAKKNSKSSEVEVDDKFFNELRNAHLNAPKKERAPTVVTSIDQIERGKQRYGSAQAK